MLFLLRLSKGRFRSCLCPTQNRPDHFGLGGRILIGYISVFNRFQVVTKSARFFQKLSDLARPDRILTRSRRILLRSRWISKRLGRILSWSGQISMRSRHISKRLGQILMRSWLISSSSGWISKDRTKNTKEPLLSRWTTTFRSVYDQVGWKSVLQP